MSLARVQEITDDLAAHLECPVAINDYAFDLIVASAQIGLIDRYRVESIMQRHTPPEVVQILRERALLSRTEPFLFEAHELPGLQARMCVPLLDGGYPIAFVWIVLGERRLTDTEMRSVRTAADALRRELTELRGPEDDEMLLDSQRLEGILSPDPFAAGYAISALVADGIVPELRSATVLVFHLTDGDGRPPRDTQDTYRPIHERARARWGHRALLGIAEGRLVAVCPGDAAASFRDEADRDIRAAAPLGVRLSAIGVSSCVDPTRGLRECFDEARFAARVASASSALGPVVEYRDLGAFIALRHLPVSEASVMLLSRDAAEVRARGSDLNAQTLRVFLDAAGDVQETCRRLSIHRTTLYYRLDRVRAIIGDALDVGWRRTSIHVALMMGELVDAA